MPVHLQVAGDGLGGACTGALAHGDDRFGEGGGEVGWVWIGGFDSLEQLNFELLDRTDLDVAFLAHGHAGHELALERAELGWSERS